MKREGISKSWINKLWNEFLIRGHDMYAYIFPAMCRVL